MNDISKPESESLDKEDSVYTIPFYETAKVSRGFHLLYGFCELFFLLYIILMLALPGPKPWGLISFFLAFLLAFGWLWIAQAYTKKPFVKLTEDYLEYKWLFGQRIMYWEDIQHSDFITMKGVTLLGISDNQVSSSFWETTDKMLGVNYPIRISVMSFSTIDFDKLKSTIESKVQNIKST